MAAGLLLVGAAVVAGGSGQPTHGRVVFFVVSGVVLFCAAEFADRALSMPRQAEQRPGADHFSATWVIAVAVGSAAASYAVISARGVFEGGGPAALAVGMKEHRRIDAAAQALQLPVPDVGVGSR